jgi:hypothetical protein
MSDAAVDGLEGGEGLADITALLHTFWSPCGELNLAICILYQKQAKCVSDNPMDFTKPDPLDRYANVIEIVKGIRKNHNCDADLILRVVGVRVRPDVYEN